MFRPKNEWIAVPVPDSGVPREWVDEAREALQDNSGCSSAGHRAWELSGGIVRCDECGRGMMTHSVKGSRTKSRLFYYRCRTRLHHGTGACPHTKCHRAERLESAVWETVSDLLKNPEQLRDDLDAMIERERGALRGNPEREAKVWLQKLAEVDRKRSGFQDMAAEGLITFEELRTKFADLADTRKMAEQELNLLQERREKISELERDRDALLEYYAGLAPEGLDALDAEERHQVYRTLKLRVVVSLGGNIEVSGAFGHDVSVCQSKSISRYLWATAT